MSRSPLPSLLLLAPLLACSSLLACSRGEPEGPPRATVHHGVDLVVAEYLTVDEAWFVDELNHVHGNDVALDSAFRSDGEIEVQLRPMGFVELHWILGDNCKVKIWLNGYGRVCGSIGADKQVSSSGPSKQSPGSALAIVERNAPAMASTTGRIRAILRKRPRGVHCRRSASALVMSVIGIVRGFGRLTSGTTFFMRWRSWVHLIFSAPVGRSKIRTNRFLLLGSV